MEGVAISRRKLAGTWGSVAISSRRLKAGSQARSRRRLDTLNMELQRGQGRVEMAG